MLMASMSGWAQTATQTMNLLTRATRQGTVQSASTTIQSGTLAVQIDGDIPLSDMTDPQNVVTARVFVSPDQGATWILAYRTGWSGGTHIDKFSGQEVPNALSFAFGPMEQYTGWLIRGELDIQRSMRIGLDLTVNPPPRIP